MLGCPAQTLEVMPYALAARAEDAGLCVCDLQVGGGWVMIPFPALESLKLYSCIPLSPGVLRIVLI